MSENTPAQPSGEPAPDPVDGEQGLLPHVPGPAGTGTGTDAGADPDAPEETDRG